MCLLLLCGASHTPHNLIKVKPVKIIVLCSGINLGYSNPLVGPLGCSVLLTVAIINSVCLWCWAEEKRDVFASGPIHVTGEKKRFTLTLTLTFRNGYKICARLTSFACRDRFMCVGMQQCCHFSKWRWQKKTLWWPVCYLIFLKRIYHWIKDAHNRYCMFRYWKCHMPWAVLITKRPVGVPVILLLN